MDEKPLLHRRGDKTNMKLSAFEGIYFTVKIGGEFETLGNYVSEPSVPYLSYAENEVYLKRVCDKEEISCIICTEELSEKEILKTSGKGVAVAEKPRMAFNLFHNHLVDNSKAYREHYSLKLSESTIIGSNCMIDDTAIIPEKDVVIGDNCVIEEYVVIRPGTIVGNNVEIGAGSKVGNPSHIIVKDQEGNNILVKQVGGVRICDNASIGCNCTIARGSFPYEYTRIGEYTKIENGVEISHNSKIGKNCIITGQSHVCGNSILEDGVRISPKAVVSNRIHIAKNATIDIGSVVVSNIKSDERVSGNFAIEHKKFLLWHRKKLKS